MSRLDRLLKRTISRLDEAFESRRFKEGEVKFKKADWNDPHLKEALKLISQQSNEPEEQIKAQIEEDLKKFADMKTKAPILYHTIVDNLIEDFCKNRQVIDDILS